MSSLEELKKKTIRSSQPNLFIYIYIYIYVCVCVCVWWLNCCHFELSILYMRLLCFRFFLLSSKLESGRHYLWGKKHYDVINSSENLEMVCCTVQHSCRKPSIKISQCLGVNLRTVQRIPKELDESSSDYEDTVVLKSHSDRPDKKRNPEFVGEIHTMIPNDPSESVQSIDGDNVRVWVSYLGR